MELDSYMKTKCNSFLMFIKMRPKTDVLQEGGSIIGALLE